MYTVGHAESYDKALDSLTEVKKIGVWGFYPGGIVFKNITDAREFLRLTGRQRIWSVYKLAGNFHQDTYLFRGDVTTRLRFDRVVLDKCRA